MKKFQMRIYALIITVMIFSLVGCNFSRDSTNEDMRDFDFTLIYGVYGKNKIDTFNDMIIIDLIEDGTLEANISLSQQEKEQIYNEMKRINIMGELNMNKEDECETEPSTFSSWDIHMNGESKSFSYGTYCKYTDDLLELIKLEDYIHNIVSSKEEYKQLPEAKGAYE